MCEFCHQHGEGKIWYLQAKNYAEDLASDLKRQQVIGDFLRNFEKDMRKNLYLMRRLPLAPQRVQQLIRRYVSQRQKPVHFGQVVPIEDVTAILAMMGHVVRIPCLCRRVTRKKEVRCCYGISISPDTAAFREAVDPSYWGGPDSSAVEMVDAVEALDAMRSYERQELLHSVWTFGTPFIAGICNCTPQDCLAAMATDTYGIKVMFRAEYVAAVDSLRCTGCRACLELCPFKALQFDNSEHKACIEPLACYGCGICRSACKQNAIRLMTRHSIPATASVW